MPSLVELCFALSSHLPTLCATAMSTGFWSVLLCCSWGRSAVDLRV